MSEKSTDTLSQKLSNCQQTLAVNKAERRGRNIVMCKVCLTVMESTHRHDFVQCSCENGTFVDGGIDYQRIGGRDLSLVEVIESPICK